MKHIKRLNIIYILFIISYLKFYANCYDCLNDCKRVGNDCVFKNAYISDEYCSKNCRPNFYFKDSEKCYTCNNTNGQYHYFNYEITTSCGRFSNLCTANSVHKKNINGTNQCVSTCGPDYYEMGDYCFSDCVGGNRKEVDSSVKKCECRYLYYISGNNPICLDENKYCESNHHSYDLDTRLCSTSKTCPQKYFILHREGDSQPFYRCSKNCLKEEYIDETDNNKCVTSCGGKYYIENKQTKEKKCTSTCNSTYVIEGKQCIEKDDCKYIKDDAPITSNCSTTCASPYYITKINNRLHCSTKCVGQTIYRSEVSGDNVCLNNCPSNFYEESGGQKVCISISRALTCYYTDTSSPKKCLNACPTSGNGNKFYHNIGSYECITGCTDSFPYHKNDDYTCYASCDLIPNLGKSYIIKPVSTGYLCDCLLYAMESGKKVCYHKEEECYNANYQRKLGNQCIKESVCKFKVEGETSSGFLKKCFNNSNECKNNNYPYYYSTDNGGTGTCWAECPYYIYASTSNQPTVINHSSCVPQCTGTYIYYSTNSKICKTKCDVGEYINPTDTTIGKECLSSCSGDYIGENNECYSSSCPSALYTITKEGDNKKNKCVSKCVNYGKYYDSTSKTCKNSCNNGQFYNSDNQCLTSCSDSTNAKNATEIYDYVNPALPAYPCLTSNQITNLYYYSLSQKKVYSTCDIFDTSSSPIICSYCNGTNQYVYNNYCVTECPLEAPYYRKISKTFSLTNGAVTEIKNCLSSCSEYIVEYSNECVNSCPTGHTQNSSKKKCFMNCPSPNQYFDPINNRCGSGCSKYYETSSITGNFICKSSCSVTNKYLNGKECVSACPSTKNKVGLNNECKTSCAANTDGKYELEIGSSMIKCLFSCPAVDYIYYISGQNKCLNECPESPDHFVIETTANNYECRTSCPYDYPYYPNSKSAKKYYACTKSFTCNDNKYFYKGECYSSCKDTPDSTNFVERRICVNGCNTTEGYTYTKTIEDGITECKKNCDNDEYIIGKVCYDNCPDLKNFIGKDKKCFSNCVASGVGTKYYLFSNPGSYKIYKCVESCPPDFPLLDIGTYECVKTCKNTQYISSEENICYNTNCLSPPVNQFTLDY